MMKAKKMSVDSRKATRLVKAVREVSYPLSAEHRADASMHEALEQRLRADRLARLLGVARGEASPPRARGAGRGELGEESLGNGNGERMRGVRLHGGRSSVFSTFFPDSPSSYADRADSPSRGAREPPRPRRVAAAGGIV